MTDRDPVLEDFARRETERADRNGARASEMEVTLMETRHALRATTEGLDEVARRHGWSEEVNCTPWAWLDSRLKSSQDALERIEKALSSYESDDMNQRRMIAEVWSALADAGEAGESSDE